MKFTPKSDKEIAEENLLPKGEYDYEVIEATDKVSKGGNDMIELKLRFFHGENGTRVFKDYLLEQMAGKLKHFCVSHDLQEYYDRGSLKAEHCLGVEGRAKVGIKKDETGRYPDANTVFDYVVAKAAAGAVSDQGVTDSDVPF
jgi:hypothetical protein